MRGGTVKQFLNALDEMRDIYHFDDNEAQICTRDELSMGENTLSIVTTDKHSGIVIEMTKRIPREG